MKIMLAIPFPRKAASVNALIWSEPREVRFPGYGSHDGPVLDREGRRYILSEYEIPETGKLRSLLYRINQDSTCDLVMDIVAVDHPYDHTLDELQIRVEDGKLRHYRNGAEYREEQLNLTNK